MDPDLPSVSEISEPVSYRRKEIRRKNPQKPDLCQICLGRATGYHYEVASCNGCKSFFRRLIIEKQKYVCLTQRNDCFKLLKPGDPMPRCRACRFKKCIDTGMNSFGIRSELELEIKKEKMKNNQLPCIIEKPLKSVDWQAGDLIDRMIRLDAQSEKFRDCAYNPDDFPTLEDGVRREISILSIADEYGPMKGWPLKEEVINRNSFIMAPKSDISELSKKKWLTYELFTQLELAKTLPFYSDLSTSDRYFLLRDTLLMSTNLTRAFYNYALKNDRLMRPDGLNYFESSFPFKDEHRKIFREDLGRRCLSAILRVGIDRVEFVLLRILVLTNPAVSDISVKAQEYLVRDRKKYTLALFHYILAKNGAFGPARLATILGFIDVLEHQQRDQRDLMVLMNLNRPKNVPIPLLDDVMKC